MHLFDNMSRRESATSLWKKYHGVVRWWWLLGFVGGVLWDENCEWEIQICMHP